MARTPGRVLIGLMLAAMLAIVAGGSALAVPSRPAILAGAIGEGASDVLAFFGGDVKGIVDGAVLGDGSVRVRAVVRGASTTAKYRVVGSGTPCGQAAAGKALLLDREPLMGGFVSRRIPAGTLPDRANVFASLRIMRVGGGQVGCAQALSYRPVSTAGSPALAVSDLMVSSFMSPGRPRGILTVTRPDTIEPQLRWSFTGLSGVTSYRIVGSTAACGTAHTPAAETFRSTLQTKPSGFTEVTGLDIQVESFRILAKSGKQLACTGRGRHVQPLL